jgi:hypothetical protein
MEDVRPDSTDMRLCGYQPESLRPNPDAPCSHLTVEVYVGYDMRTGRRPSRLKRKLTVCYAASHIPCLCYAQIGASSERSKGVAGVL